MPTELDMPRPPALRNLQRGILLGIALVIMVTLSTLIAVRLLRGPRSPVLTRSDLEQAWETWQARGPSSYEIEISVTGIQAATYRVQIQDGQLVEASRNGTPLPSRPRHATWSVPGMFDTIRADLANQEAFQAGNTSKPQLSLRAEFDTRLGVPRRYQRMEQRSRASNSIVTWEVTKFEIDE